MLEDNLADNIESNSCSFTNLTYKNIPEHPVFRNFNIGEAFQFAFLFTRKLRPWFEKVKVLVLSVN